MCLCSAVVVSDVCSAMAVCEVCTAAESNCKPTALLFTRIAIPGFRLSAGIIDPPVQPPKFGVCHSNIFIFSIRFDSSFLISCELQISVFLSALT